jgi:hypothetical protein
MGGMARVGWAMVGGMVAVLAGCGWISDKSRLPVATVDGKNITRGDLEKLLYQMEDDERPLIRTQGDLLRELNKHIDRQIKLPLGRQLAQEKKIAVPRELALEQYFQSKGEEAEHQRMLYTMDEEAMKAQTALMETYSLTPQTLRAMKDIVDLSVDEIVEEMQGEAAVQYLAMVAVQEGKIKLDPVALEQEYALRRDELLTFEWMKFDALRFPTSLSNHLELAAEVRRRLDGGESFDALKQEFAQRDANFVVESEIENNPALQRFQGFWQTASGAQVGQVLGPVYMPTYQQISVNEQGQQTPVQMPDSYMVLRVLETRPSAPMTLEQATPMLAPTLVVAEQMERLRQEHGVEVFEENLPPVEETRRGAPMA